MHLNAKTLSGDCGRGSLGYVRFSLAQGLARAAKEQPGKGKA